MEGNRINKSKERIHKLIVQAVFLLAVAFIWEITARAHIFGSRSELVFPTLEAIAKAFVDNFTNGYAGVPFWMYILNSMKLLLIGLLIGIALSFLFTGLAMLFKTFYYIYNLVVSVFDLLPGVALLPVVIIIFGINPAVIVFLVVHAVIWPMSRNILDGFGAVPRIYVEAGKNIGVRGVRLLTGIYIPATTSYIVSGIKVSWARAWRGLISAEMIFGIASCPGIGLYINQMRTNLKNAEMYATLIVIILIGVIVQYGVLEPIEKNTIKRWGMTK
jgi:NitT/TauT family transport system permease protein